MFLLSLTMAIFAPHIIGFFRKDIDVIAIGALSLRLNCISLPVVSGIIITNMLIQTMGRALEASIVATSRQGILLIPFLFIFNPLLGLRGIQLAVPVSDLTSLAIVIPILIRVIKILSAPDEAAQ